MAASIAPAERCRKHMHITAIANAVLCLLYFSMILLLDDDRLHLSTAVIHACSPDHRYGVRVLNSPDVDIHVSRPTVWHRHVGTPQCSPRCLMHAPCEYVGVVM